MAQVEAAQVSGGYLEVSAAESAPDTLTGGALAAEVLARSGVEQVFMLHGAHVHGVLVGCVDRGIGIIGVRHEVAAGHAAEGYARAGRRLGVALITAGPGMTNVVTSMADAHVDRTPVLYLSGSVQAFHDDTNALQSGVDQVALAKPITKWAGRAHRTQDIPRLVAQAIRAALTPPMGPTFLEIPLDVLNASVRLDEVDIPSQIQMPSRRVPDDGEIAQAVAVLAEARRPAIMAGADVYASGAWDALREFAEVADLPVFCQFEALGCLPSDHSLFAGSLWQMTQLPEDLQPDVVLAVGVRFGWNAPGFQAALDADVIHVSVDETEFGRPRPAKVSILADSEEALRALTKELDDAVTFPDPERWLQDVRDVIARGITTARDSSPGTGAGIHPHRIAEIVCETVGPETIIVGDGALTKHWLDDAVVTTRQRPGTYLTHGPLGAMGIGLGLAMGARLARPDQRVLCLTGDGSLGFTIAELDTMVRHDIPVVIVVMNNQSFFGLERFPRLADGSMPTIATDLGAVRYEDVAVAFNGFGRPVEREEDLVPAIEEAFASGLPSVINVSTARGFGTAFSMGAFRVMQ